MVVGSAVEVGACDGDKTGICVPGSRSCSKQEAVGEQQIPEEVVGSQRVLGA